MKINNSWNNTEIEEKTNGICEISPIKTNPCLRRMRETQSKKMCVLYIIQKNDNCPPKKKSRKNETKKREEMRKNVTIDNILSMK
jgi:hypothetical protein